MERIKTALKVLLILGLIVSIVGVVVYSQTQDCLTISSPDDSSQVVACDEPEFNPVLIIENDTCRDFRVNANTTIQLCNE